jgi:hypothetical protein
MSEPEWLDDDHIIGEMSEEEFNNKLSEQNEKRKENPKETRGVMEIVWQKIFDYKGIKYLIKVVRYGVCDDPSHRGMNDLGKWVLVEYPEETKDLVNFVDGFEGLGFYEFLYKDTLHAGQEHWSLKRMYEYAQQEAKSDIDKLCGLTKELKKDYQKKLTALKLIAKKYPILL